MIRVASEEIRRIQNELQPSMLRDLGIAPALDWFCREYGKSHEGIRIEKRVTGPDLFWASRKRAEASP